MDRLAWGGKGVARAEDGRLILLEAPLALFPGEKVEAELRWKPRHGEGRVTRWIRKDPRRAAAGCPVAGVCGGCELWEAGPHQADLKRQMVEDLFHRQLGELPWAWHPAPSEAKRHRIQLHWDGAALGFHRRNSHSVVPVRGCPAAVDPLSEAIPRLLEAIEGAVLPGRSQRWELATGAPAGTVLATDESGRHWTLEPDGWHRGGDPIAEKVAGATLRHEAGGFFQVSPEWAAQAFGGLLASWGVEGRTLFDLYGGVGLFSALLRTRFQRFVLVESLEPAVAWARRNLADLRLDADCHAADVAEWVTEGLGEPADLILLDPPRAGLDPALAEKLLTAKTDRMVLVGCDGAAFCRDLKRLAPAWSIGRLAALDLFPLTHHVECVALLKRA
ncbi:MAG TPA: hypothetical protein VJ483_09430 [Holophagaceae bacterium]|nr:hypothetical protein [Holophagaceae bacterium]